MTTVGVADLVQTWIDYYRPMVATMTDEHLAETIRANQDLLRVALRRRAAIQPGDIEAARAVANYPENPECLVAEGGGNG